MILQLPLLHTLFSIRILIIRELFLAQRFLFPSDLVHLIAKLGRPSIWIVAEGVIRKSFTFLSAAAHASGPHLTILQTIRSAPSDIKLLPLRFFANQLQCKPNRKCPMVILVSTALQPCVPLTFPCMGRSSRSACYTYFTYFRCHSPLPSTFCVSQTITLYFDSEPTKILAQFTTDKL